MGWLGLMLYLALVFLLFHKLWANLKFKIYNLNSNFKFQISNFTIFLVFLGISIAALFLHAWEDSAVAYTVWMLAAVTSDHSPISSS